jgi:hypothetical protein
MVELRLVMLLTEGMIIPIRARGAGKVVSACPRSSVVTVAMIVHSAVTGDWRAPGGRPSMGLTDNRAVLEAKLARGRAFLA